jgi:hypothetical protein
MKKFLKGLLNVGIIIVFAAFLCATIFKIIAWENSFIGTFIISVILFSYIGFPISLLIAVRSYAKKEQLIKERQQIWDSKVAREKEKKELEEEAKRKNHYEKSLNSCIQLLPSNYIDAEPYAQEYLNNLSNKEKVFLDELNTGKYSKKIIHETFNDLVIQSKAFFVNRMENYISNKLRKNEGSRDIIKNELLISKISTSTDLCTEIFSSLLKDKYLSDEEFDNTINSEDHFNINKTRKWEE